MKSFFVIAFVFGLFCFSTTVLSSLTGVSFENGFAVFRQSGTFKFELNKDLDILLLEQQEKPTLENSLFGIIARRNRTKKSAIDHVHLSLYKNGVEKTTKSFDVDNAEMLKHLGLTVNPGGAISISIFQGSNSFTIFNWPDSINTSTIPYIGIRTNTNTTFYDKEFFIWSSNLHELCPFKNAYFSCDLKIKKPNNVLKENVNVSSSFHPRIMHMKMLSDSSNSNYELIVTVDQTGNNPRIYIKKDNVTNQRTETIFGDFNLIVNMSADSILIRTKNSSVPLIMWSDPASHEAGGAHFFSALKHVFVQNSDTVSLVKPQRGFASKVIPPILVLDQSEGKAVDTETGFENTCQVFCNPTKELPWYTRFKNKVKGAFSDDD